ncbi:D-3-phosphoglycerate dehydrogenase [Caballeronia udeis]|uniref:D-3-phosphoglycerate dehydrogenase n=1 Tax=Caballeronia udeis TaxID=1232866 RepID=A0ABW8MAD6_9BURK
MPHVLVAGRIHDAGLDILRNARGLTFDLVEDISVASYAPLVPNADAILIRTQPLPRAVIESATRLKIVSRHGVGFDAVDVDALTERSIPLAIIGDVISNSVAEHSMMLVLALAKRTIVYDQKTRASSWQYRNSYDAWELHGRTLLLLGFGRIGKAMARMAAGFNMKILAYDPYVAAEIISASGVTPVSDLRQALAEADVVSVHMPKSVNGPLLGARELGWMKLSSIVVNTARGGIVDEQALREALSAGRLAGAGLDVFESEPPGSDNPLFDFDNVVLSPHSAGLTEEAAAGMAMSAATNIVNFFAGHLDPALVVNDVGIAPPATMD